VNYGIQGSGPVTALTTRRVRYGVGPDLICQPGPSPGIKTHSSPAAFPSTLSLPFSPWTKAASAPDLLRHHYVTTASSCCRSPLRLVWVQGGIGAGADCAAIRPMGKKRFVRERLLAKKSRIGESMEGHGLYWSNISTGESYCCYRQISPTRSKPDRVRLHHSD
jgi:hypothetical protein